MFEMVKLIGYSKDMKKKDKKCKIKQATWTHIGYQYVSLNPREKHLFPSFSLFMNNNNNNSVLL